MNLCKPNASALPLPPFQSSLRAQIEAARIISEVGIDMSGHLLAAQAALRGEAFRVQWAGALALSPDAVALRQAQSHLTQAFCAGFSLPQRLQAHCLQALGEGR